MKIVEVNLLKESTYQTPCGTIHYWSSILSLDTTTLVFLPVLTADPDERGRSGRVPERVQ